jgi:hypothetical protein
MSDTTNITFWYLICETDGCELAGISFPIEGEEVECGGCNTEYQKP